MSGPLASMANRLDEATEALTERGYHRDASTVREAAATIATQAEKIAELKAALEPLVEAAHGLSFGTDWNEGTHVKLYGYRQKLLDALPDARQALTPLQNDGVG